MPGIINGMTFNVAAGFLQFDSEGFLKAQKISMIRAMKSAAKVWLTTALSRIPRDTGFLHSGFMNLAAFLGSRINESGQVKRGRDLHGQEEKLAYLQKKYKATKNKALAAGHVEEINRIGLNRSRGKKVLKKKHANPLTIEQRKTRPKVYKKKQQREEKLRNKGTSKHAGEQISIHTEEGLGIHKHINTDEKKSGRVYKGEKNKEFYNQQRERREAARSVKRLKKLQHQIHAQKTKVEHAAANAPEFQTKKRSGNNYYTTINKTVYENREVEELNPAYPHNNPRQLLIMKKAGTLPPKTIKISKKIAVIIQKRVRKKNPVGPRYVNKYQHYYYPRRGQKGPLKTPLGGIKYGTPPDEIIKLNSSKISPQEIATETVGNNNKGVEVVGNDLLNSSFGVNKSLNMAQSRLAKNAKLILTFDYKVDIRYLRIMDIFKPRRRDGRTYSGAPWASISTANKAFMGILKQEYAKLAPSFISYVVVAKGTLKTPGFKGGI